MAQACTVVIAAADLLPALAERTSVLNGQVLTFSDVEALRALEEIIRLRPEVVALERQFAATPRGAALINRIKADPTLADSELRVVSHDGDYSRVLPRSPSAFTAQLASPSPASRTPEAAGPIEPLPEGPEIAVPPVVPVLDQRGTRRAPRFRMAGDLTMMLDGTATRLIDLSEVGAQVVSPIVLKPNQRVRASISDEHGALRFNASIAWAFFEIPSGRGPQYRAGVNFVDADGNAVGAFCMRHKQS